MKKSEKPAGLSKTEKITTSKVGVLVGIPRPKNMGEIFNNKVKSARKAYKPGDMVLRWVHGQGFVPSEYNETMRKRFIRGIGDKCFVMEYHLCETTAACLCRIIKLDEDKTPGINDGWTALVEDVTDSNRALWVHINKLHLNPPLPEPKVKTRVVAVKKNGMTDSYGFNGLPDFPRIVEETFKKGGAQTCFIMSTGKDPMVIRATGKTKTTVKKQYEILSTEKPKI